MRCSDIRELILAHGDLEGVEAQDHLASCAACQLLVADGGALGHGLGGEVTPDEVHVEALSRSIGQKIDAERGLLATLRERPSWLRVSLAALVAALVSVAVLLGTPRIDLAVYPLLRMLAELAAYASIAGIAIALSLRPLHRPPLSSFWGAGLLLAAVLLPWVLGALPHAHSAHPESLAGLGDELFSRALSCFIFGLLTGAPLVVGLLLLDHNSHRAPWRALLAAGSAGLLGNLALLLHCPIVHPEHLLAGHASAALTMLALYGAVVALRGRAGPA